MAPPAAGQAPHGHPTQADMLLNTATIPVPIPIIAKPELAGDAHQLNPSVAPTKGGRSTKGDKHAAGLSVINPSGKRSAKARDEAVITAAAAAAVAMAASPENSSGASGGSGSGGSGSGGGGGGGSGGNGGRASHQRRNSFMPALPAVLEAADMQTNIYRWVHTTAGVCADLEGTPNLAF